MTLTTKLNTNGCCDGSAQVHQSATDDPNYVGALSYVTLCKNPECMERIRAAWDAPTGAPAPPA